MNDCIIDEQGHFWWRDIDFPDNHFAPEYVVTGRLRIGRDGATSLDLDGLMPDATGERDGYFDSVDDERKPRAIQGILKQSGRHIVLLDAVRSGGTFNSEGFSNAEFIANFTLVGKVRPPRKTKEFKCSQFDVDLRGFEDWLDVGSMKVTRTSRTLKVSTKRIRDLDYKTSSGRLTFKHHLIDSRSGFPEHYDVTLREYLSIQMKFTKAVTVEGVIAELGALQNLLIILTGSDFPLSWPKVTVPRVRDTSTLYFRRLAGSNTPPKWRECPVRFPQIRVSFGELYLNWKNGLKVHGAGYFAFPATKRNLETYLENRFSNLVYGLESFHRSKYGSQPRSSALQAKIDDILSQVAPKHRGWLNGALKFQGEPSLKERLMALFQELPVALERSRLDSFAKRCADLRNDIAHFGGKRTRESSSDFLREVSQLTEALSTLYHMVLLIDIGVSEELVHAWVTKSFRSFAIVHGLVAAGLVKEEASKGAGAGK